MAKKKRTLGCLFYIALVLLVLVVFLFNRGRFQEVLERTGFTKLFQREQPADVVVTPLQDQDEETAADEQNQAVEQGQQVPDTESEAQQPPPSGQPESKPEEVVITVQKEPPSASAPEKPEETPTRTRQARLFYISVTDDGQIRMKGVIRAVPYVDAPLTATLEALLQGPSTAEVNQGLISLISPQTRINRVYIKGQTAYIDFNEAIRFNSLGKQGMIAELKQIVYTATEFPTVENVQILIEGQVSDYMGPEGVGIGNPLDRDSFQNSE